MSPGVSPSLGEILETDQAIYGLRLVTLFAIILSYGKQTVLAQVD